MTSRAVRVPGSPTKPSVDGEQATQSAGHQDAAAVAARDAAADAVADASSEPAKPAPVGSRPHPSTVDPKRITAPVLTSQGWICPDTEGRVDNTRK